MTKKLIEIFDLPESVNETSSTEIPTELVTQEALTNLEKIENALPQVRGLEASDIEMDNLANLATDSYRDLMDLGMTVESRFSAEIFGVAGTMLGHAITAKTAKLNKKLKMIELQLKKASLDLKNESNTKELDNTPIGQGKELDRNELLKILAQKS